MVFEKTGQSTGRIAVIIRARSSPPGWSMRIDLDRDTGEPLYPVHIEQDDPGITIMIDDEENVSVSFPPVVPGCLIENIRNLLGGFNEIVKAAHELIKAEREKFIKTR